ncbi:hypothetical protein DICSQDRAFT_155683 [Dichomitus squalens LYAD-421 SS1]|uniref:Uncharacterized protein n=2 Tax=Dichomitus squalens TaxID=114155 RepID=A0A4Q9MKM0_9APHY|nr:uncharacterized protein DICSQDRAFT_155683 [Dichomitus squalens LYAD-421 SS1]EJF60543.1 hypothetical protein DICSQDRAFT_155683 [Dichomitus squalens LYAD-421 SS1]TBU28059.1 hypothetical protein BD311DRAFT_353549 [Dichomitus squalens]
MASQFPSGSPTSTDSAPSETSSNSGNDNPGFKPGSSLPFSFLVTFIAIFLFFLGCGIGSRRVTRTLRRNLGLQVTGLELDRRQSRIPRARPLLLDVFPKETSSVLGGKGVEGMFSHSWKQLAPLGATYHPHNPGVKLPWRFVGRQDTADSWPPAVCYVQSHDCLQLPPLSPRSCLHEPPTRQDAQRDRKCTGADAEYLIGSRAHSCPTR